MHPLTGSRLLANDGRFRFDATSAVVSTQSPPQGATQVSLRLNGLVAGNRSIARPLLGSACQHAREGASRALHSCVVGSLRRHLGAQLPHGICACHAPRLR